MIKFKLTRCYGHGCPFSRQCSRYTTAPSGRVFETPPHTEMSCRSFVDKSLITEEMIEDENK